MSDSIFVNYSFAKSILIQNYFVANFFVNVLYNFIFIYLYEPGSRVKEPNRTRVD